MPRHSRDHDRRRRHSPSDSRSAPRPPREVDFEQYKAKLIRIFFRDEDLIPHGSSEYREFWKFLHKYQALERKKRTQPSPAAQPPPSWVGSQSPHLGLKPEYDRSLLQCLSLEPSDPKDLLNRLPFQDEAKPLTEAIVMAFRHILGLYMDFLQKEKMRKIRKLRASQAQLPIAEFKDEILRQLQSHQVVIVAGDTGCGKSTQVPQYLLQAGYQHIACTQPRRIACISLAKRVGFETLNEFGTQIGYQIRFEKKKTDKTKVLFLTEGLLLRQVSSDPSLSGYDVIVLDEVHERHLHGDYLLGIVKCLVHQRDDIKVMLMSATINIKLFQDYFQGQAPVVQVPGRLFPIKLEYHPIPSIESSSTSEKLNPAPYVRILQLIDKKYPESERGDLLIFLSGIKEITTVVDACQEYADQSNRWIILPLHSTLSLADQDKVFDYPPDGVRKCIVATNIAETSITIDGVRFVVDSGKVKEMQYDPVCKMRRLKEFWISRASAEQRKGRSGRTGPGVCFRLFSDAEYKALASYATPEIQRVPLDNLILQMISMGLPDARKFPFIEPPPAESIENSILMLKEQGALHEDETLTISGKMLANLPVDVTIGKMLIMGTMFHQVESVLSLAAALSVQSPFTNQAYKDSDCVAARRNLDSDHGDPITLLNSYREWLRIKSAQSESSRKWCKKRGLEEQRFYEMTKLRAQFKELLEQSGLMKKDHEDLSKLSSSERAARHGELKHLRGLKRDIIKSEGPKKKKILKMSNLEGMEADEHDDSMDIKDIEFRMRNDGKKVQSLLQGSQAISYKDMSILKLIVSAGLYPQYAVADEFNHAKSGADQLFHTRVKPFNVLHPNSIFAASPDYLRLDSMDVVNVPGFSGKYPVSLKHQLLVYLSLLETNKPYLMGTMRMPLLQTMLLFSHTIDSNSVFSRLVFDSWVETRFPDVEQGQNILFHATKIREQWQRLLQLRLEDTLETIDDPVASREEQKILEATLAKALLDFMHTEVLFSVKRLLPGDIKILYLGSGCAQITVDTNPFLTRQFSVTPHDKKGGMRLTEYLIYGCLENSGEETHALAMDWTCGFCEEAMYVGPLERIAHFAHCKANADEKEALESASHQATSSGQKISHNAKAYFCEVCRESLMLSGTEVLKHKRQHRSKRDDHID